MGEVRDKQILNKANLLIKSQGKQSWVIIKGK